MEYEMRKITGRYSHLEMASLERKKLKYVNLLKSLGSATSVDIAMLGLPLWAEVEFLENIVEFEFQCNPYLRAEMN